MDVSSLKEERLLWNIWEICCEQILAPITSSTATETDKKVNGLIASTGFLANYVIYLPKMSKHFNADEQRDRPTFVEMRWETIENC